MKVPIAFVRWAPSRTNRGVAVPLRVTDMNAGDAWWWDREMQPAHAHFVWFISAAEGTVLTSRFGVSDPPSLGRVLLDNAMVLSANDGLDGRIGLHAAANGGNDLLALYQACGLKSLPVTAALPNGVRRQNDGRFFYADDATAASLITQLDPQR